MAQFLTIPKLGSTMTSAVVTNWYKSEGDPVQADEPVVAVETDKITHDLVAPEDGYLLKILVPAEEEREIGVAIGVIGQPGETW
jgi:pyruvate/2-oxoglutarate dehydrogenase complex dihydrolipoamide acyltransferase (E2) component